MLLSFFQVSLVQDLTVSGDGHDLPRNELSAITKRDLCRSLKAAAARNLHADDRHALDIVVFNDLGQLFAVIHRIQLA